MNFIAYVLETVRFHRRTLVFFCNLPNERIPYLNNKHVILFFEGKIRTNFNKCQSFYYCTDYVTMFCYDCHHFTDETGCCMCKLYTGSPKIAAIHVN